MMQRSMVPYDHCVCDNGQAKEDTFVAWLMISAYFDTLLQNASYCLCGLRNKEISLDRKPGTYFGVDLSSAGKADELGSGSGRKFGRLRFYICGGSTIREKGREN